MRKSALIVSGVLAGALLLWGVLHVMISPVNPAQEAPDGHVDAPCALCHIVSEGVDLIEEP